jgi:hypothetical protein
MWSKNIGGFKMQEFNIVYSIDGGSESFATISWDNDSGQSYLNSDNKISVIAGLMLIDKILQKNVVYEAGISKLGVWEEDTPKGKEVIVKKYAMTKGGKLFEIQKEPVIIPTYVSRYSFKTHISVAYAVCRYMEQFSDKSHEIEYKLAQLISEEDLTAKGIFLCGPGDPT